MEPSEKKRKILEDESYLLTIVMILNKWLLKDLTIEEYNIVKNYFVIEKEMDDKEQLLIDILFYRNNNPLICLLCKKCLLKIFMTTPNIFHSYLLQLINCLKENKKIYYIECLDIVNQFLKFIRKNNISLDENFNILINEISHLVINNYCNWNDKDFTFTILFSIGNLFYNYLKINNGNENVFKLIQFILLKRKESLDVVTKKCFSILIKYILQTKLKQTIVSIYEIVNTYKLCLFSIKNIDRNRILFISNEMTSVIQREYILFISHLLNKQVKENIYLDELENYIKEWNDNYLNELFAIIGSHDISLISTCLNIFNLYTSCQQSNNIDNKFIQFILKEFNPTKCFYYFLKSIGFDKSILIDLFISKETCENILIYFIQFCKWLIIEKVDNNLNEQCFTIKLILQDLHKEITNLNNKHLFPYPPNILLQRLQQAIVSLK
ncbi:hypothetical protein ABK040_013867 [Willaertia magna]